ncbi:PREDICTED: uncharacterized protein DDB_G0290685-like [Papilio xuthus]|uniref:Uncharacterized protein DDB_G0290685-like n=1 Tax=Papilio xuthus TaxID=66420 RepID=A0AAJ6ZTA7_PAPXU|nr:PREDICTED: uncharacterized protein DDB_G0290685-like [Papilio xuthus]
MENCKKPPIQGDKDNKRSKRSPKIATKTSKNKLVVKSRRHKIPYKSNKIDYSKLYFGPQRRDISEEDNVEENPEEGSERLNAESVEEINISIEGNLGDGAQEMMTFKLNGEDEIQPAEDAGSNDDGPNDDQNNDGEEQVDGEAEDGGEAVDDGEAEVDGEDDEDDANVMNVDIDKEGLKHSESEEETKITKTAGIDDEEPNIDGVHLQYSPPEYDQANATSLEANDRNEEIEPQNAKIDSSTEELDEVSVKEEKPNTDSSDSDLNTDETQNSDCPTECPAREVMVCARCKAGVYRTFLSVCHLRLFSCNHPEEKLELVSRRPCILSAPFLTGMKTKGKQKDPNDEDIILKFIRCREKGDTNDPKCKFDKKDSQLRKKI